MCTLAAKEIYAFVMMTLLIIANPLHRGRHETFEPFRCCDTRDTCRGTCTSPGRGFASCGPNRHRRRRHYPAHCPHRPCWYRGIRKPDRTLVEPFDRQRGRDGVSRLLGYGFGRLPPGAWSRTFDYDDDIYRYRARFSGALLLRGHGAEHARRERLLERDIRRCRHFLRISKWKDAHPSWCRFNRRPGRGGMDSAPA